MADDLSLGSVELPLIVGGVALLVGIYFAFREPVQAVDRDRQAELEALKQRHLEALRELEADKGKLPSVEYKKERERLLLLAEDVLRKISEGDAGEEPQVSEWTSSTKSDIGTVFLLIVGCLMAFGLYRYSKERGEGETLTGASMEAKVQVYQQSLIDARETLKTDPENIEALHLLSYNALLNRQLEVAMKYIEVVRKKAPEDPELLVHMGILKLAIQSYDQALVDLTSAIEKREDLGKAYLWRALLYSNLKQNDKALADAQKALPLVTLIEEKRFLSSLMDDLQRPPPIVSGVLEIESPSKGVVFVIARRNAEGGGPPVAVRRYRPAEAISFELGKSDMVMGGVWPDDIWLEARLDADGNVMTKDDAVSSALIGPLSGIQEGVSLKIIGAKEEIVAEENPDLAKVKGTLTAEEGYPKGVVFVIARRTKEAKGPPVAVKKLEAKEFPLSFSLGSSDLMMGGEWPAEFWLEARLDTDGDAMTKTAADWYAESRFVEEKKTPILELKPQ